MKRIFHNLIYKYYHPNLNKYLTAFQIHSGIFLSHYKQNDRDNYYYHPSNILYNYYQIHLLLYSIKNCFHMPLLITNILNTTIIHSCVHCDTPCIVQIILIYVTVHLLKTSLSLILNFIHTSMFFGVTF